MFHRIVSKHGRVTIPSELMEKFNIKEQDQIIISHDEKLITIKKTTPEHICVITNEISEEGEFINGNFVSKTGLIMVESVLKKEKWKPKI